MRTPALSLLFALALIGCDTGTDPERLDAGPLGVDAGPSNVDGGLTGADAGPDGVDGGDVVDGDVVGSDAATIPRLDGSLGIDAGDIIPRFDGSIPRFDGSIPRFDGGIFPGFDGGGIIPGFDGGGIIPGFDGGGITPGFDSGGITPGFDGGGIFPIPGFDGSVGGCTVDTDCGPRQVCCSFGGFGVCRRACR